MRAMGMQVLTDNVKAKRPGATIYGIGDAAHKLEVSGHNEDDTPGVRAEDQDPDNIPEHRAIDVMIDSAFSAADAEKLYDDLGTNEANQKRLLYVIYNKRIRSRSRGWEERPFDGDSHENHVHVSGEADEDDNENNWILSDWGPLGSAPPPSPSDGLLLVDGVLGKHTISKWQMVMGTPVDGVISTPYSQLVAAVQRRLNQAFNFGLTIDGNGIFQDNRWYHTAGALQKYLGSPVDGRISTPTSECIKALQRRLNTNRF
jgi:hypothetical protein